MLGPSEVWKLAPLIVFNPLGRVLLTRSRALLTAANAGRNASAAINLSQSSQSSQFHDSSA